MKRCIAAAAPAFSTVLLLLLLLHYLGCAAAGYVVPKRSARRAFTSSAVTSFTSRETTHLPPSLLLPLLRPWSKDTRENLEAVLREIVDSTAFFVDAKVTASSSVSSDNHQWQWTCSVPAFGDDCRIQLELLCSKNDLSSGTLLFSLVQDGASGAPRCATTTAGDFGWICTKFYECSAKLGAVGVDCSVQLRDFVVVQHSNCDAATAAWSAEQAASFERMLSLSLLGNDNQYYDVSPTTVVLDRLDAQGYVIIDHKDGADIGDDDCSNAFSLETTATQQELLSNYYFKHGASSQGASIRTDRVHFLSRAQAAACGVEVQYDLLMGIAHYLNNNYGEQQQRAPQAVGAPTSTWMQPVFPATVDRPFTLPRSLQFAEYGLGDYYIAHSDNALTAELTRENDPIRTNFRAYTCILYMNDNDWDLERDGGALRLYPDSQHFYSLEEAVAAGAFVDISPTNGRLLIFDSRLVHSVQTVTSNKRRRALTLWINRPNNSGVRGEVYYQQEQ